MSGAGPTRRATLRLFTAGAAALVAGCRRPAADVVPYRDMPEGMVPGQPLFFATSLPLGGAGRGVLVESHQGRPTKVHGNTLHPASLGATDVFAEAAVLDLFDPNRSTAPRQGPQPVGWGAVQAALAALPPDGRGVALITGPVGSPTLARQIAGLLKSRPGMAWHSYRTVAQALEVDGAQLWPDFSNTDTVVTLDADPLGPGPGQIALTRGFAQAKRVRRATFRSYAFGPSPSLTSAQADRSLAVHPAELGAILDRLAGGTGEAAPAVAEAAKRLARGRAMVLGGAALGADLHGRIADLNARIGAPLARLRPFWDWDGLTSRPVPDLATDIAAGRVAAVIVLGCNPAYDLGPGFADLLSRVPQGFHFGVYDDETARICAWHAPLHHPLEDWSDLRAVEGSVGLVQPLIAPLFASRSAHEVLAMLAGPGPGAALDHVRQTWRGAWGTGGFDARWMRALHDGVVAGTGPRPAANPTPAPEKTVAAPTPGSVAVRLAPSPSLYDGSFAANAWLQECPEPFTKQVWGNAVWLSAEDAGRLGLTDGDPVTLRSGDANVTGPVAIVPGQAPGTVTLHHGYGRRIAGPIGSDVGFAVTGLGPDARISAGGEAPPLLRTQSDFSQEHRDLLKTVADPGAKLPDEGPLPSFYERPDTGTRAWAMVIDTDVCTGCNACTIACQSENNVPVVGPDEVALGRIMHWLRIDAYDLADGGRAFQPVPCMHCEEAPCEPVCPVGASVHDSEGLNVQVYNRCVGTRFCQADCPYKVRRFNFRDYTGSQAWQTQGADLLQALRNPDVSVRGRGVMEKCTYCVQRISSARRQAEADNTAIPDGAVVTACQAACPAQAITFGDMADPDSAVRAQKDGPRHYALLGELGTRPRTTYLAKVRPAGDAT